MKQITEPAQSLDVVAGADVVVVGGGPGGIMAALGAARAGASTILVERYGFVGGMATAGLMTSINGFRNQRPPNHVPTVRGYAQELIEGLIEVGGADWRTSYEGASEPPRKGWLPYSVSIDPEALKRVAMEMLCDAGVEVILHTTFSRPLVEGRRVVAAAVENKSGRQAIEGTLFVDATGDGDLCARAGARFAQAATDDEHIMAMSLMYRVMGIPAPSEDERRLYINGLTTFWGSRVGHVDGTSYADLTRAEILARRELAEQVVALRRAHGPQVTLVDSATTIGVRETRRILGLYTITEEDALSGRPQPDSIAVSSNPVPGYYGQRRFLDHLGFEIPYRSLVPADLDNVLTAGRCISAEQAPFQSARSMAPNMAYSQAAGTAAALCVSSGCLPRDLDVAALQERLEREGAVVRVPPEAREGA